MSRLAAIALCACATLSSAHATAQDLLIRNATVHTATARGTLQNADVLVRGGRIAAVGRDLAAGGVPVVDAQGRPLTPTLFGGISGIGLEEVSGEDATTDGSVALGQNAKDMVVRPEFDVTLAYNPDSVLVPVTRVEGIGFTLLGADATAGGSIIVGQGAVVRLDGSLDPAGPKVLFLQLGGGSAANLTGSTRAAQWMLLDQLVDELRGRIPQGSNMALLTPAGRATLSRYLDGGGRVVVRVHLASAGVPVFVDPLANLPADFDQLGASLETAARLRAAGVTVGFTQAGDASHNARKTRQLAGNAVANGLSWDDGLAGITRVPAQVFGVGDHIGSIAPGMRADLVLWDGDPLEVTSLARQVWFDGRAIPMRSRQSELRDRYLRAPPSAEGGDLPRAYPAVVR
jgi:hypothetical protein